MDSTKRAGDGGHVIIKGGDGGPGGPGGPVTITGDGGPVAITGGEGGCIIEGAPGGDDSDSWVPAVSLWQDKLSSQKHLDKFRRDHPNMFRNPSKFKLEIHAGLWVAYWSKKDKAGFDALDGDLESVADDPNVQEAALEGAIERAAELRQKKAGKHPL